MTNVAHRPEETPLYGIVATYYPRFVERLNAEGGLLPAPVRAGSKSSPSTSNRTCLKARFGWLFFLCAKGSS